MRKITSKQILVFFSLLACIIALAVVTTWLLLWNAELGDFRGLAIVAGFVMFMYLYAFAVYRVFLFFQPLEVGEIAEGSRAELTAQVNNLFYLMLFNSLIRTHFLPIPALRLVYLALGARLGPNSYSAGALLDPPLTQMGANCIVGHDAVLFAHIIEGRYLGFAPVILGDDVTVGAMAVVMPDVVIGDGAIVSAGAVVVKGTRIGAGEVWGGVPAKCLRKPGAQPSDGVVS